jgi:hypothetical protein
MLLSSGMRRRVVDWRIASFFMVEKKTKQVTKEMQAARISFCLPPASCLAYSSILKKEAV